MSTDATPTPPLLRTTTRVRGGWAVAVVAVVVSVLAVWLVYAEFLPFVTKWSRTGRGDALWFAGVVIRSAGAAAVAVLLWRYAVAVRRHNAGADPDRRRLNSAHAKLWQIGAAILLAHVVQVAAVVVTAPAARPVEPPPRSGD